MTSPRQWLRHLTFRMIGAYKATLEAEEAGKAVLPLNLFLYHDARSMNN